jgi:hypothetical protein
MLAGGAEDVQMHVLLSAKHHMHSCGVTSQGARTALLEEAALRRRYQSRVGRSPRGESDDGARPQSDVAWRRSPDDVRRRAGEINSPGLRGDQERDTGIHNAHA